ncbi:spore coat associated protein CotJA [Halothermothrix orenii]|uniref:spore coat associated protein CotJA n=1 Tax=Halothermothrix orenii TaxID=31909 RepID=UPI0002D26818|nr:spore coat associated protein CotJA [Halothermothrix orenii]
MAEKKEMQRYPDRYPGRDRMRLSRAYIPFQRYTSRFSLEEALQKGTLFPELYMPYRPGRTY